MVFSPASVFPDGYLTLQYHNFGEIGKAAFQMTVQVLERKVSDKEHRKPYR